jgi:condensation domain-containing protein
MADSMLVRFTGEGSGIEQLTWGQFTLWTAMARLRTWLPIGGVLPLPPDTTVDDVADRLRFWISRYQTMRTRLRFDPDGPRQVVSDHGEIALEIVDAADAEDPATVADRVEQAYRQAPYDFTAHWPVRMGVVRHRGALTHQVVIMCHLVTDAAGAQVMMADLAARDPVTGAAATPPPRMQPLEEARWQGSPAGRRQSSSAIRFAEEVVRRMPARRFGGSTDPRQPRYRQVGFSSPAAHLAMLAIGARAGAGPSLVFLTVFMIALARVSGTNPAVAHVLVNNRFRPQLAEVVAPHTQAALFMVDVGEATFDEALTRTRRRSLVSYKHSYYDQRDIEGLEDRIGKERGEELLVGCFLNDRRLESPQARGEVAPAPPVPAQVRAALAQTRLWSEVEQDEPFEPLFVNVNNVPDTIDIMAQADTHHIAPADLERLFRELEGVAVAAAFDGSVPTGVPGSAAPGR